MRSASGRLLPATTLALVLAGCGGGGGGGGSSGDSSSSSAASTASTANTVSISVDPGPANGINLVFASVTVCSPGAPASCQLLDHVLLDTASVGLRIAASALPMAATLPQQTTAGAPVAECAHFADGVSWGSVRLADIQIAAEQASSVPVHVIGDPGFSAIPSACTSSGAVKQTPKALGANGILGVGVFRQDCGAGCATSSASGIYYVCPASGCQATALPVGAQVQNPVAFFASDNNGVVVQLPAIPPQGSAALTGTLGFGIGTRQNNALGSASAFAVDPSRGVFTTFYKGATFSTSFIDSGSNGLFFQDATIPLCSSGFYCPASTLNLSATIQGTNGTNASIGFSVANANQLFAANPSGVAFNDLAASNPNPRIFDWGLPFFYGRSIFVAIEGAATPGGTGPYFAF